MIARAMWMLPTSTKTDLEAAAKLTDISVEGRTNFLEMF
jgi:hypothetical protein